MAKFKKTAKKTARSTKANAAQAEQLSKTLSESAQQVWLAGVGAFSRAQTEGTKLFEALIKEGLKIEQNALKFAGGQADAVRGAVESKVGQARERATDTWDRLEKVFEDRVQRALTKLGVPGRDDLAELTTLGCGVNAEGGITIPWVAAQPLTDVDTNMAMLVTGEAVPLRQTASADARQLGAVSWDFVTLSGGLQPNAAFQQVRTGDEKTGYIASDKLRSPLDYRVIASSRDGKWSFTSLVAGD